MGIIAGGYKFTQEDREKAGKTKRINSSLRKIAKKVRGMAATDKDSIELFESYDIPVNEQTVGYVIVLKMVEGAKAGNKDDRRDFMRLTGDDPDVIAKEADIELKKAQAEQKTGGTTDIEDLSGIWGMINEPDTNDRLGQSKPEA